MATRRLIAAKNEKKKHTKLHNRRGGHAAHPEYCRKNMANRRTHFMYAYRIWTVESRKRLALFPEIYKTEQEVKEAQKK